MKFQLLLTGSQPVRDLPLFTACGFQASDVETASQRLCTQPPQFPEQVSFETVARAPQERIHGFLADSKFPITSGRVIARILGIMCLVLMGTAVTKTVMLFPLCNTET